VLTDAPARLAVHGGALALHGSRIAVYDSGHRRVVDGTLRRTPGRAGEVATALPKLPEGVYTAVWRLGGKTARQGAFAFAVDRGGAAAVRVVRPRPHDELAPMARVIPRWLAFASIMVFLGALGLRLLVTAPAARRAAPGDAEALRTAGDRALLVLAGAAILCFIPATLAQLVNAATDKDAGLSFWASIRPAAIADFLTDTPDGHLWAIRLGLTALAAAIVVPVAAGALRRGWRGRDVVVRRVMLAGFALGTAELVVRVIPTEAPPSWPREIFTAVLDWGHMFSAAIWVGGLAGLLVVAALLRVPADERGRFWPVALRRFSAVAAVCVGAMILTGLWTTWLHVGPPRLLVHTLYGETLLVKLVLFVGLVGLGALNQLWLLPRLEARRREGGGVSLWAALRHFRVLVAAEVALGIAILLVVPFLSGSARRQAFQAQAADLTQTRDAGGQAVRLRPSAAQPGLTDYDVWVAGARERVTVTFSSPALGVPGTEVVARPLGGDHYRVSGLYTPIVGTWRTRVAAGHGPAATFQLAVTATPAEPGKPPPPVVQASTWAWGTAELLAVVLAVGGATLTSRRLTRRRTSALAAEQGAA
jgi:putative copper resistance protein D